MDGSVDGDIVVDTDGVEHGRDLTPSGHQHERCLTPFGHGVMTAFVGGREGRQVLWS